MIYVCIYLCFLSENINVLAGQTNKCALLCFRSIRMSDEPLVTSPEKLVFEVLYFDFRLVRVGVLRKNNCYTEGCALACATRCIVQSSCVELYSNTCRATECFYLRGIQLTVNDILLSCKKEDNFVSGLTPSYQYRKPSISTVSPIFRFLTA